MRDQVVQKAVEEGGQLKVRSALNPILWLCGIVTIPTLITGRFYAELPNWIILLACAPVAVALFGFLFLLFFDRDKLQSEEYQLRMRSLELAQQKGDPEPIELTPAEVIENPDVKAIPEVIGERNDG